MDEAKPEVRSVAWDAATALEEIKDRLERASALTARLATGSGEWSGPIFALSELLDSIVVDAASHEDKFTMLARSDNVTTIG